MGVYVASRRVLMPMAWTQEWSVEHRDVYGRKMSLN